MSDDRNLFVSSSENQSEDNRMSSSSSKENEIKMEPQTSGYKNEDVIVEEDEQDDDHDAVVTMLDVLEEEKQLEEQTYAVLAASDDKNCTYDMGYVPRQALYSCKTCYEKKNINQLAGICLACSLTCHEGHDLFELYTKRNFRCDCGNSKFPSECKLNPKKAELNNENKYNHNFNGLYCTCNLPYPDAKISDKMIQCGACEDWFHLSHINVSPPKDDEYSEFICCSCIKLVPFLHYYKLKETSQNNCSEVSFDSGIESSSDSTILSNCILTKLKAEFDIEKVNSESNKSIFWQSEWRSNLCKCSKCLQLYKELNCEYFINETDSVDYYEAQGKEKSIQISQYERGLNEISKMDRIKSIEAISECNTMAQELKDFLKKFAENKKVVREEDINEFFEGFKARKRPKFELSNCR